MHTDIEIRVLGVIPARGGSKGVKRKNVRILHGKPLIAYSIQSAQESKFLSEFIVSTDDDEISRVATEFGAAVIARPPNLAQDKSPMLPVLQHALIEAENRFNTKFDYLMILQPTAPLRCAVDIDDAILKMQSNKSDSLVSLYEVEDCHPARMYTLKREKLTKVMEEPKGSLRQALPSVYHRNGCIYMTSRELLMKGEIMGADCIPHIMDIARSVNIDTEQDLEYAEFVFSRLDSK